MFLDTVHHWHIFREPVLLKIGIFSKEVTPSKFATRHLNLPGKILH